MSKEKFIYPTECQPPEITREDSWTSLKKFHIEIFPQTAEEASEMIFFRDNFMKESQTKSL